MRLIGEDREIGIERQHAVALVNLCHPHNARIDGATLVLT